MSRPGRTVGMGALAALLCLLGCASGPDPADLSAEYHNIGNAYFELRKYDKAIRYYEMALERNPDAAGARWNLALAYYRAGSFDEAEKILQAWLERDPKAVEAREALALVYRGQARPEEALVVLEEILAMAPEDTAALNNKAIILWELERRPEAVETFRRYLDFEPYDADTLYNLMMLHEEQGMSERAREYAESFLAVAEAAKEKNTEDIVTAGFISARAYARAEAYYKALEAYARIVELDAKRSEAWFEQSEILLTSVEDPGQGMEALAKALDTGFGDAKRIALLLAREDLLDRDRVTALLGERKLMPADAELEAALRSAATVRAPTVAEPRGPWAEPGAPPPAALPPPVEVAD